MPKLTYLSAIRFSGNDAGSFLHSQISADVLSLADGDSTFACYCEPKGRVLALMLVQKTVDDYLVIMSGKLAVDMIKRLTIYRMRSKVEFETLDEYGISGMQGGTEQEPVLDEGFLVRVPGSEDCLHVTPQGNSQQTDADLQTKWRVSELSRGVTWLNPETSGQFLPQMLGFEQLGAVNYRKGCYPGQEIVARTHYLGKVKRHPRLLKTKLHHRPEAMDKIKILEDDQAYDAVIADSAADTDGTIYLLAITRMEPDLTARKIEYMDEIVDVI